MAGDPGICRLRDHGNAQRRSWGGAGLEVNDRHLVFSVGCLARPCLPKLLTVNDCAWWALKQTTGPG